MRPRKGVRCPDCGWNHRDPDQPSHYLTPGTILSKSYVVGRGLGAGGFGVTYLAWDAVLHRRLAIKEYLPVGLAARSADRRAVIPLAGGESKTHFEDGLERFVDEGRALAKLRGTPCIVSVLTFFSENRTSYLVMDYEDGVTLEAYTKNRGGRLEFEKAMAILSPVMHALARVHQAGVLHRDISPDNIFVDDFDRPKLLDFGAAKRDMTSADRSLLITIKGGYSPIEQYGGTNQGPWTDVYAMAATLYRTLTGVRPPEAPARLRDDPMRPPGALAAGIPPIAAAALVKALAVNATDRYQTISEFHAAILKGHTTAVASTGGNGPQTSPRSPSGRSSRSAVRQDAGDKIAGSGGLMKSVTSSRGDLSGWAYALFTLIALLIAVGLAVYSNSLPKGSSAAELRLYYITLIPFGLACAAFLFGTLRSYARFSGRRLGWHLEMAGPVVLFVAVLLLGFRLVRQPPNTFNLTVFAQAKGVPLISKGSVMLRYEDASQLESFGEKGDANFKQLPDSLRGKAVLFFPKVEGFASDPIRETVPWEGSALTLNLERLPDPPRARPEVGNRVDPPKVVQKLPPHDQPRRDPAPQDPRPDPPSIQSTRQRATRFIAAGDCASAAPLLNALTNIEPSDSQLFLNLGVCEAQLGNIPDARIHLQRAEELDPRRAAAVATELAKVALAGGDSKEANRQIKRALQSQPWYPPAMIVLGDLYTAEGERQMAINTFDDLFTRLTAPGVDGGADIERLRSESCKKLADAYERNGAFDLAKKQRGICRDPR